MICKMFFHFVHCLFTWALCFTKVLNYTDTAAFLARVTTQEVFLFGTAGFGGAPEYFDKILSAARQNLPDGATVCGSYMCQGKMPMAVRARYEQMEDSPRRQMMIENFDAALSHPDASDLSHLRHAVLDR